MQYPSKKIPPAGALYKRRAGLNAYSQASRAASRRGTRQPAGSARSMPEQGGKPLRTFVYANSNDSGFTGGDRALPAWPAAPHRRQHRELQSFMFDELRLLEEPGFRINALYSATAATQVDVLGYSLDDQGRILYATDYGVHGDGNPAFQCTDIRVNYWDMFAPVTLFPCGSVELYDLLDIERWAYNTDSFGQYYITYGCPGQPGRPRGPAVHPRDRGQERRQPHRHALLGLRAVRPDRDGLPAGPHGGRPRPDGVAPGGDPAGHPDPQVHARC